MPIRFRCGYCSRLLGIARRKAGTHTTCPHCNATIAVPPAEEFENGSGSHAELGSQPELAEIDRLLKSDRGSGAAASPAALASPAANEGFSTTPSPPPDLPTPPPSPAIAPKPAAQHKEVMSLTDAEKPRVEPDVGATPAPRRKVKVPPKPVESADEPMPLDEEPVGYVITPQKMTALAAVGVVLVILAFTAGYFVGAR
jgi:hypothetical protein